MNYSSIITGLYYLLIYADGSVNEREITSIKQMVRMEGLDEAEFMAQMHLLQAKDNDLLFAECAAALKNLDYDKQVRVVAWLCVVANADGFMERTEWQLIYKLYHRELNLPLSEIFNVQKELNRVIWEQTIVTIL